MIIVTGGAGFIGSNLVRGLNGRGRDDVLVVDDLEHGDKHRSLNALRFADFVDFFSFRTRLTSFRGEPVEAIFHQGACSDTMEGDGRYMLSVNYEFSKELLAFAQDVAHCPFLYASSASVYGNGERGFREDPDCEYPLNVYAFSKLLFDRWVRRHADGFEHQVAGLRYFNVYGPQENHKGRMASVVLHFHEQIRGGGKLRLFEGSEDFRRDFVYVDDVVDVNLFLLEHPEVRGVLNCGSGRAESFLRLAREVQRHYPGSEIETIPFPDALRGKYQTFTEADLSALRAAGWTAEPTPIERGVERYVAVLESGGGYYRDPAS